MELEIIDKSFAVCKLRDMSGIDLNDEILFMAKTDEEISLVCEETSIPADYIECERGWKGFRITGTLDFALVGILAKISSVLAENNISIFAISTFNTDYILVKIELFRKAIDHLKSKGYVIA